MSPRRPLSTSARVALTVSLTLVVAVVVLSSAAYLLVSDRLRADLDRALVREAEAFSAAMQQDIAPDADLRAATRAYITARAGTYSAIRPILMVRFADGRVVSNSYERLETADGNAAALKVRGAASRFLDVTLAGTEYRAATVPVRDASGSVVAVFEAALPTEPTRRLGTELLTTLAGVAGGVGLLGTLLSFAVARAALKPLERASRTAERVTQSSLGERIDYLGPEDEVGRLVASVNSMLDRLEHAFGEQRRFVADASHELRTPLAAISGHLDLLADHDLPPGEREAEVAIIAEEVARLARITEDLLALARLETGPSRAFQPIELATLAEEVSARARVLGDRRVELDAPSPVWVSGDPDGLMQAALNLLANAFAHTRPGGLVRLSARAAGSTAVLEVADDGPGVSQSDLARVFDRFYRGREARGAAGSGLGLAITKRLVELHGGKVSAADRDGGGAVFSVSLPRIGTP